VSCFNHCVCGLPLSKAAEVRREEGIGNRIIWVVLPKEFDEDDPNDSEDCCLMCRGCGRILEKQWDTEPLNPSFRCIDRVNPDEYSDEDGDSITESVDIPDIPQYFTDANPKQTRYPRRFKTVAAATVLGDECVVAILERLDLIKGSYFHVAFFPAQDGIGNRRIVDWTTAYMSRGHGIHAIRQWYDNLVQGKESAWHSLSRYDAAQLEPQEHLAEGIMRVTTVRSTGPKGSDPMDYPVQRLYTMDPDDPERGGVAHLFCPKCDQRLTDTTYEEGIGGRFTKDSSKSDQFSLDGQVECAPCGLVFNGRYPWARRHDLEGINESAYDLKIPWEFTDNGARDGVVRVWRVLRHFEDDLGVFILADRRDLDHVTQLGLFPKVEGIGNRTEIDWSHVRLGVAGSGIEIENRYEICKKGIPLPMRGDVVDMADSPS
jgi:hypothetical protein